MTAFGLMMALIAFAFFFTLFQWVFRAFLAAFVARLVSKMIEGIKDKLSGGDKADA